MTNDVGVLPSVREWTDAEKKIVALSMAIQAAMTQFIAEGLLPAEQQRHFLSHLQDFAARLYAGEDLSFGPDHPTFRVLSQAGDLFLSVTEEAIHNGKLEHLPNPSSNDQEQINVKPTLH